MTVVLSLLAHVARDSWREEADYFSSEAATLRETVQALRQYSENDTIDQLLEQASAYLADSHTQSRASFDCIQRYLHWRI